MRIRCPWCGDRPLEEFTYFGDATVERPNEPAEAGSDAWHDYLYLRDNPAGLQTEFWQHISGCRIWLVVERDTNTHEIYSVALASERRRQAMP